MAKISLTNLIKKASVAGKKDLNRGLFKKSKARKPTKAKKSVKPVKSVVAAKRSDPMQINPWF